MITFGGQDEFTGIFFGKLIGIGGIKKVVEEQIKWLPIKVSESNRERAYRIMNAFLKVIEDYQGELKLDNGFKIYENRANDFAQYSIGRPILY